jgi:hypothetical protein
MAVINLSNGSRIRTFSPPREGVTFDPLTASAAELAIHGFPARPEDPAQLALFQRHYTRMKGRLRCIEPTFTVRPSLRPSKSADTEGEAGGSVPFWSGAVVYAPSGQSFKWLQAEWVVPNVSTAIGSNTIGSTENAYVAVSWIGLGNSSLLQAGAGGSISPGGQPSFFLWHEWTPPGWVTINNLQVNAGDLITVLICTPSGAGSTLSTIYFTNNTQGLQTSYEISFPEGAGDPTSFLGDQAEWIVERPSVTGGLAILPNYGEVFFSSANAVLTNGSLVNAGTPGGNNGSINMVTTNGVLLSTGTIVSPTVVQCQYNGPVDGIIGV